ncbi:MAG: diguanylate cyclase domain-containing protein [Lysobacteraceae bacterium]|jgi:diguanylate cyclase|nr:diguanylate cyclase [Silanimonas sp.]
MALSDLDPPSPVAERHARLRALACGLGLLPVAVVLRDLDPPGLVWALAVANGLLWPWVARRLAAASPDPVAMERRSLAIDAAMVGVWIALLRFSLVPSAVLLAVLLLALWAFGGPRFAASRFAATAVAALLFAALDGFVASPATPMPAVLATLPLLFAAPAAVAHAAWRLAGRVQHQSQVLSASSRLDPLTGLGNALALHEAADHEFRRFRRGGYRATLLVLDIDRLGRLNDAHGRAAGDEVLRSVAALLDRTLRDTDTCARLEGGTFAVVLTDAHGTGVGDLAERLRHAIGQLPRPHATPVTVSLGYAQIDARMADRNEWLAAARQALGRAKAAGRNRAASAPTFGIDGA